MSTTRQLILPGSIRWNAGSDSSPNRPSVAAPSRASKTSSAISTASPKTTTNTAAHSHGQPQQTLSSKSSPDYVIVFPGQNTSYDFTRCFEWHVCDFGGEREH